MAMVTNERSQLEHVEEDLLRLFTSATAAVVHDEVQASLRSFEGARIRAFIPVLVAKRARDHLRALQPERSRRVTSQVP